MEQASNLTLCSCHVTYAFQSESTLYSCLNVKELLARSRCKIGSLSDCNWTRTHNHLFHKQTLNSTAEFLKQRKLSINLCLSRNLMSKILKYLKRKRKAKLQISFLLFLFLLRLLFLFFYVVSKA